MPDGHPQPVFPDATVISNFSSTNSIEFLARVLEVPVVVPAVRDEIEQGADIGHEYLTGAVEAFDDELPVSDGPPDVEGEGVQLRERPDPGETDALRGAVERDGTVATDDLAARRLAADLDVPVTGSIGLPVLGIKREHIDSETADEWIDIWRNERGYYAPAESVTELLDESDHKPTRTGSESPPTVMDLDSATVRDTCTDAVFERAQEYRDANRIRRVERFDAIVTAEVRGTDLYDVTVRLSGDRVDARCTCPYAGPGECKHVVAVLLDVVRDPPEDTSQRIDPVLNDVAPEGLRAFVRDALAESPRLRQRFLARFGERTESVESYRREVTALFGRHTQDSPVITDAIDLSRFFTLAEEYRARDQHLAAATIYRALFETIDENTDRIDAAYDHYTKTLQTALDEYVECVLTADVPSDDVERYASVLEDRLQGAGVYHEAFQRALDDLRTGRDGSDG